MPTSVKMPQLGESVTEGTVTRWLKAEGEHVDADEPLLEVSTDKVDTEVPSPASGVLTSIKVREDETVEIGVELAVIGDGGAAPASSEGPGVAEQTAPEPVPVQAAAAPPTPPQAAPAQPAPNDRRTFAQAVAPPQPSYAPPSQPGAAGTAPSASQWNAYAAPEAPSAPPQSPAPYA